MTELAVYETLDTEGIIALVLDGMDSEHSKRAYRRSLLDFLAWWAEQGRPPLSKALVQAYRVLLASRGLAGSTVNQRLSAIRKLATEAADNGLLGEQVANGIGRVKGVKSAGVRTGHWLTQGQAQALLDAPDTSTLKGLRDRAILAVLLGAALRRAEVARLTFAHIRQVEGRWAVVDLVGKRQRVRSIPLPAWAKAAIDVWAEKAGITDGKVFRPMLKGDKVAGEGMTPQAIRNVVNLYAGRLGLQGIAPHDLRRTWAKLAYSGGAQLDQIQLSLGHASIKTTEDYLGIQQDFTNAPCDRLGLRINGQRSPG